MTDAERGRARRGRQSDGSVPPGQPQYARGQQRNSGAPQPPYPAQTTQPPLGSAPAVRSVLPQTPGALGAVPPGAPGVGQQYAGATQQQHVVPRQRRSPRPARPTVAQRPQQPMQPQNPGAQRPATQRPATQRLAARRRGTQLASDTRLAAALARSRAWARPASVGARLAAYSIDAAVCAVLAVAAGVLLRSVPIGAIVLVEAAVILLVIEARTGATVGNLLLRQRTTRDDSPFSPGAGRGFIRGMVQGAGSLVAFIGGWAVVATSAADPMRMGRSWADRAGRTLVVTVPTAAERSAWVSNAEAWAQSAPERETAVTANSGAPGVSTGIPGGGSATPPPSTPPGALHSLGGPPPAPSQPTTAPRQSAAVASAAAPQPAPLLPPGAVPVDAPIPAAPAPREVGALLLLAFDTGQRAQLRIPAVANLGRRPDPSEADDQLVAVEDADGSVSKTHLRLEYRGDSVWVTDLGSTNGSEMIDDTGAAIALARGARTRLEDGASVRIGQRSFTVATITGEL